MSTLPARIVRRARARRLPRPRARIFRSRGRPRPRRRSSTPRAHTAPPARARRRSTRPAPTASRGRARRLLRNRGIMSRRPAPATRRRFRLAITSRTRARRASSWRCRRSYRARQRGNPRHPGNLTRRSPPSRSPIRTSMLQIVFRSRSRAPAERLPTAQVSPGSRRARPTSTPCREPRPRSPASSTPWFLLRARARERRH